MVTGIELGESGGEVCRVSREEIAVNAIQCVFNLHMIGWVKLHNTTHD